MENGVSPRQHSLPSQLSYDVKNQAYTHGIDVHNLTLTGTSPRLTFLLERAVLIVPLRAVCRHSR